MIGDHVQSFCFITGISFAPPYLANMWYMSPLYIIPDF